MVIKRKFTHNKREFEGQMNYSAYLLSGGILDQAPKELVELVIKALEGDQESGKSLSALIQLNPEAEGLVQQIAEALTSNSSPAAMKCGGRVLKAEGGDKVNLPSIKTRKLEGKELSFVESTSAGKTRIDEYKDKEGNKYRYTEFTDHKGDVHKEYIFNGKKHKSEELHEEDMKKFTKSTKKAERGLKIGAPKCGCALKKVGGRLIEVDSCTGLPVHQAGGMVKKSAPPEIAQGMGLIRGTMGNKSIYFQLNNAYGDGVDPNAVYGRHVGADGKAKYYSNYGATDATWDANTGSWTRGGHTYNPQSGGLTQNPPAANPAAVRAQPATDASALADAQAFAGSKTMDKRAFKQYMRNNETEGARFRNRAWKVYHALDLNAMQAKQAEQYKDPKLIDYSQYKTGGQLNYGHYFQ